MRILLAVIVVALALAPAQGWAEGKSGQSKAGGKSAEHISEKGQENTNAQNLPDAERGQERAEERKVEQEEPADSDEAEEKKAKPESSKESKQKGGQKKDSE
jgi:hypothetical protein